MVEFAWDAFAVNDYNKDGLIDTIEMTLIATDGDYVEKRTKIFATLAETGKQPSVEEWSRDKCIELAEVIATRENWREEMQQLIESRIAKDQRLTF